MKISNSWESFTTPLQALLDDFELNNYYLFNTYPADIVESPKTKKEDKKEDKSDTTINDIKWDKVFKYIQNRLAENTDISSFKDLIDKYNIPVRITSEYREGSPYFHGKKDKKGNSLAIDIVPIDGDFNKLRDILYNTPEIKKWFIDNNYGVLEELTDEYSLLTKTTKATGSHFHIGPDKNAVESYRLGADNWYKQHFKLN